uniref:C2H2-type domain-containing protein n=1 Tax=Cacopsylla melanoneura TaxID=428564 RepID=A0A8D8T2H7_9HEMI
MKRQFKYTCFDCGKSYKNRTACDRHRKTECGGTLACPACPFRSSDSTQLRNHIIVEHTPMPPASALMPLVEITAAPPPVVTTPQGSPGEVVKKEVKEEFAMGQ